MLKRALILLVLLNVHLYNVKSEEAFYAESIIFTQTDDYFLHTVERGQTVYSISVMYKVSVESIYQLNPDSRKSIQVGSALKIPQISGSYYYHTIQPKETLYSVSKKYGMKGSNIIDANPGLSIQTFTIGKTIRIPTNQVNTPMESGNEFAQKKETEALLTQKEKGEDIQVIKVALLLPFGLKENTNVTNASTNRFVEYYEGFLLALEQLKNSGISVHLQVHDIGDDDATLSNLLKQPTMQDVHLLVGGLTDKQIKSIASFARNKNIPYVIPFTSKNDEPLTNPQVFQINTPQSYLYSKVSTAFCRKYKGSNYIFFISDPSSEKMEFIQTLESDLTENREPFRTITYSDNLMNEIKALMRIDKMNVVVPSDDSAETLLKMTSALKPILDTNPEYSISIFGYPGWQVYGGDYMEDYFRLRASFYSVFYIDPAASDAKSFYFNFNKWYSRDLINTFPKFGVLGYDTGMFFIKGLHEYGTAFTANVKKVKYKGIQTDFQFERVNNWGGFINTNIYIISFNPDLTITKNTSK